jgi:hypothetical protein
MSAAAGAIVEAPLMLNSQPTNRVRLIAERLLKIILMVPMEIQRINCRHHRDTSCYILRSQVFIGMLAHSGKSR